MKTYGIVAHPVAHSLSPPMQNAGFEAKEIHAEFIRFDVPPEELKSFTQKVRKEKIAGLAVSLPHKENVIQYLDEITETAKKIGAVNTLYWKGEKLCGDNTDAPGFFESISPLLKGGRGDFKTPKIKAALIGAGGAGRAMAYALKENNINVTVFNRTEKKAKALAEEFGIQSEKIENFSAKDFDIVANSTSVGLKEDKSPVSKESWGEFSGIAFDAVFDPLITTFLQHAKKAGAEIITGETMLLFQGVRQFETWTGEKAPIEAMREGLEKALKK